MENAEKQSKYFILLICLSLFLVVVFGYYNIFLKNDFEVTKQIACDPAVDSCFVSDCESSDSTCDSETTYEKISVPSKYAGSDYDSLTCTENSSFCKIINCEDDTLDVGEKCFE